LNLINPLELFAFVNKTKAIFSLLTKLINQYKPLKIFILRSHIMELNFVDTVSPEPSNLKHMLSII